MYLKRISILLLLDGMFCIYPIEFEIKKCEFSILFFFNIFFALWNLLRSHMKFRIDLFPFLQKTLLGF